MMARRTLTVVVSVALAGCLAAVPLSGCQSSSNTGQATPASSEQAQPAEKDAPAPDSADEAKPAEGEGAEGQQGEGEQTEEPPAESAPTLQTTSSVTIPVDFFEILGITESAREDFLGSLGCTDIEANDDGSYVVKLTGDDYTDFATHAYQAIQEKINSSTSDGTYTGVKSVDYDETFATVVVVLSGKELPQRDVALASNLGHAANVYQQIANLPVSCDVIVMNSEGEQLSETTFSQATSE